MSSTSRQSGLTATRALLLVGLIGLTVFITLHIRQSSASFSSGGSVGTTFFVPADKLFRLAVDVDQWATWRSDVDEVRHLDGETHRIALVTNGVAALYEVEVDFEGREMTAKLVTDSESYGRRFIISVTELNGPGRSEIVARQEAYYRPGLFDRGDFDRQRHHAMTETFLVDLRQVVEPLESYDRVRH